jgi:D-serine deaminase-like pyridoxal phosphate-dependent protein
MLGRAAGKPIRVASKSIRCREMLNRIAELSPRFQGLLCFTLPEALWLYEHGWRDLVVAYPTTDRSAIRRLARLSAEDPAGAPVVMADHVAHFDLIESAIAGNGAVIKVCLEIDPSWRPFGRRGLSIGPKRSPVRTAAAAVELARDADSRPGIRVTGVMVYEGQIAGVGDSTPGQPLKNLGIRAMQRVSIRELGARREKVIAALRDEVELEFVNGGGTGSLHLTSAEDAITELAAGSGFYAPVLFDHYRAFRLRPAAAFALPLVRQPEAGVLTALGGGYVASGPVGADRLPEPWLPEGLKLDPMEGAGEVQTPVVGPGTSDLVIGDRVYFRHAKAGELCERFDSLYLVQGEQILAQVPTYRGEGRTFL